MVEEMEADVARLRLIDRIYPCRFWLDYGSLIFAFTLELHQRVCLVLPPSPLITSSSPPLNLRFYSLDTPITNFHAATAAQSRCSGITMTTIPLPCEY